MNKGDSTISVKKSMHYERAPELQKEAFVAGATCRGFAQGFAPAPPGFSAFVPLPIRTFRGIG
jgi:hypothetical protein